MVEVTTNLSNLREAARTERVESNGSITASTVQQALESLASRTDGSDLTTVSDTNVTITVSASNAALLHSVTITAGWAGQLALSRGGLGLSSTAVGSLFVGVGTASVDNLSTTTTVPRYLANTGTTNRPQWDQVDLAAGVKNSLALASLATTTTAARVIANSGTSNAAQWDSLALASLATTTTAARVIANSGTSNAAQWDQLDLASAQIKNILGVTNGGTNASGFTPYAPLLGGTTTTGAVQSVSNQGTTGYVLTDNGPNAIPSYQPTGAAVALRSKILSVSRDMSSSTANVTYTGVGFAPSCLQIIGTKDGDVDTFASGMADSAKGGHCIILNGSAWKAFDHFVYFSRNAGTDAQFADVNSYDSDGFTLGWTKVGTATAASVTFYVLCLK